VRAVTFDLEPSADFASVTIEDESPADMRGKILALESAMRLEIDRGALVENTKTMPLEHLFIPGAYARALTIPAGTLLVGKIHKHACFNFVMRGEITVLTESGTKTLSAGDFFRSEPGVKRVGLAHTDTVWVNVHPTEETDLDALERELTADSYEEYQLFKEPVKELGVAR
jgi:quercetin dioxygenase-like cupin family protein